jgi:hypothetical protein
MGRREMRRLTRNGHQRCCCRYGTYHPHVVIAVDSATRNDTNKGGKEMRRQPPPIYLLVAMVIILLATSVSIHSLNH